MFIRQCAIVFVSFLFCHWHSFTCIHVFVCILLSLITMVQFWSLWKWWDAASCVPAVVFVFPLMVRGNHPTMCLCSCWCVCVPHHVFGDCSHNWQWCSIVLSTCNCLLRLSLLRSACFWVFGLFALKAYEMFQRLTVCQCIATFNALVNINLQFQYVEDFIFLYMYMYIYIIIVVRGHRPTMNFPPRN